MHFVKMHGIGNDYVYLDCVNSAPPSDPPALSRAISDRHFGIGSDGLILVCKPTQSGKADVRMRMFNVDGSEAEMCGNGVRCVAKLAFDHGLSKANPMRVETARGVLTLHLKVENEKVRQVTVDMGEPILQAELIPTTLDGPGIVDYPWANVGPELRVLPGVDPRVTCVSMGNPHVVIYAEDVAKVPLERVGPALEHKACFPRRINVHFVQVVSPTEVIMRTWERGTGVTLACGTGACAVAVAGVLTGRTWRRLLAHLPGGDLELHWSESDNHVHMTGPATEVFRGEWEG
jgi:diaminopimelate epimerase